MGDLSFFILLLSLPLIFSEDSLSFNNQSIRILDEDEKDTLSLGDLIITLFKKAFKECYEDIIKKQLKSHQKLSKMGFIINYIGKGLNDLGDEIECRKILNGTKYVIADMSRTKLIGAEEVLAQFLNLSRISLGACITDVCENAFTKIMNQLLDFQDSKDVIVSIKDYNQNTSNGNNILYEIDDESTNINYTNIFIYIIFFYLLIKFFFGIIRLIYIPKGYEKHVAKILTEKGEMPGDKNIDEQLGLIPQSNNESMIENINPQENNINFDLSPYYPLYLRILRFFDFFNDVKLLSTWKNRYFNDNGLESINLSRVIVLVFLIFFNTFISFFELPSRDILNQSFFSSFLIFVFRISTHSIVAWIFLEGAYTSYKLMKFIKSQMFEYSQKAKINVNKRFHLKLIIIYGKFIVLFIPKILIFLFCYFCFYNNATDFYTWFSAKTTYKFIIERRMFNKVKCHKDPFSIFYNFFTFNNIISSNENYCYDFTYIYINIFLCTIVFMLLLYIIFLFQKKIVEIIFILINIGLFFGLIFCVKDDKIEKTGENINYSYYHYKGQEYLHKIAYLSLGVYHFGFILGILCFNYDKIKTDESNKKVNKINNNINTYELPYYPLSFMNKFLIWLNNVKAKIRYLIIFLCIIIMILISILYKFSKDNIFIDIKEKKDDDKDKIDNEDIIKIEDLIKSFTNPLKYYFLFERYSFLILFFIINIIMITLPKKGFYKKLVNFNLNIAISRTGFIILCLYYIFGFFSFCGFLIKLKFNFYAFFITSIGNFLILFFVCFMINIVFELPLRKLIKTLLRNEFSKNKKNNNYINFN